MREPEIIKAVAAAWLQVTGYDTLLPGGLHESRADADNVTQDRQTSDFGIITVNESSPARNTNGGPIREHLVKIELYTVNGLTSLATCQNAMLDYTSGIPGKLPPHTALDNGGYVVDFFPAQAGGTTQTNSRRGGKQIAKTVLAWRLQTRWAN